MGIHIAVGKVHRGALQLFTAQIQNLRFLQRLLTGGIIDAEALEFFLNSHVCSSLYNSIGLV